VFNQTENHVVATIGTKALRTIPETRKLACLRNNDSVTRVFVEGQNAN
jgi:hypothetical protein